MLECLAELACLSGLQRSAAERGGIDVRLASRDHHQALGLFLDYLPDRVVKHDLQDRSGHGLVAVVSDFALDIRNFLSGKVGRCAHRWTGNNEIEAYGSGVEGALVSFAPFLPKITSNAITTTTARAPMAIGTIGGRDSSFLPVSAPKEGTGVGDSAMVRIVPRWRNCRFSRFASIASWRKRSSRFAISRRFTPGAEGRSLAPMKRSGR